MKILCDNPDYPEDKGQVSLEDPGETWPICEQLPCQCLGFGMSKEESLEVLQTSCPSEESVDQYTSVSALNYTIPKRQNCGTYKPNNPNSTNTCFCDDYDPRKCIIAAKALRVTERCHKSL